MKDLAAQLREDRALRDASLALIKADIANLRANLEGRSLSERLLDRVAEGAADVFEEAVEVADNHRGVLMTLLAAVVLWFARHPLLALLKNENDESENGTAPDSHAKQGD